MAAHTYNLFPFFCHHLKKLVNIPYLSKKKYSLGLCLRKMLYFSQSKSNLLCLDLHHMIYKEDRGKYSSYFLFYLLSYPTSKYYFFLSLPKIKITKLWVILLLHIGIGWGSHKTKTNKMLWKSGVERRKLQCVFVIVMAHLGWSTETMDRLSGWKGNQR